MYSRSFSVHFSPARWARAPLPRKRRLEITAAFGRPVVPEVNRYMAMSPRLCSAVTGRLSEPASALPWFRSAAQLGAGRGAAVRHEQVVLAFGQRQFCLYFGQGADQLLSDDALLRLGDGDAMGQGPPAQVGVDIAGGGAELVQGHRKGEELNAVLHQQTDHIPLLHAAGGQLVGVAVGLLVELRPGEGATLEDDRRALAKVLRIALHATGHAVPLRIGTRLHALLQLQQGRHLHQCRYDVPKPHDG